MRVSYEKDAHLEAEAPWDSWDMRGGISAYSSTKRLPKGPATYRKFRKIHAYEGYGPDWDFMKG
ncbi:hypothetical protein BGX34_010115 [Mortierella sp. NVP85]|nr:hypothetical protein BGX34_010115 [Mortierella sp. NVP85]